MSQEGQQHHFFPAQKLKLRCFFCFCFHFLQHCERFIVSPTEKKGYFDQNLRLRLRLGSERNSQAEKRFHAVHTLRPLTIGREAQGCLYNVL